MDTEIPAPNAQNWEVYRDALAPNQDKPLPKPWERAAVPAHAARLQGQKIWKRSGIRSQNNKENDAAQLELEKGGVGSRKRARLMGQKENIGNAPWKVDAASLPVTEPNALDCAKVEAPKEQEALQFVPRKRTNDDHVITPRKPMRQDSIHLETQAQLMGLDGTTEVPEEKPARRRKSMRKSLRQSIITVASGLDMGESSSSTTQDTTSDTDSSQQSKEESKPALRRSLRKSEVAIETLDKPESEPFIQNLVETSSEESTGSIIYVEAERSSTREDAETTPDTPKTYDTIDTSSKVPLNDHQSQGETASVPSTIENLLIKETRLGKEEDNELPQPSLESEQPIMPSIELHDEVESAQTPKTTRTPKKQRGAAAARRGTRRSTRTRSSSAKAEQVQIQEDTVAAAPESSIQNSEALAVQQDSLEASVDESSTVTNPLNESSPIVDNAEFVLSLAPKVEEPSNVTKLEEVQNPAPESEAISFDLDEVPAAASIPLDQHHEIHSEPVVDSEVAMDAQPFATDISQSIASESKAITASPTKDAVSEEQLDVNSMHNLTPDDDEPRSPSNDTESELSSPLSDREGSPAFSDEQTVEILESFESVFVPADQTLSFKMPSNSNEELHETATMDPATSETIEAISENAPPANYDHDDTDMLRNFLTRVKANKAAKAAAPPKRKRSLPHSPLQLPLGEDGNSMTLDQPSDEFDIGLPAASPSKRRKRDDPIEDDDEISEPKSTRRSGRTRLPVVKSQVAAPSFIPVRRLGQDLDTTVVLRGDGDKEIAAKTRVNTRKNKGTAVLPHKLLAKRSVEKEDPALRQRQLKEVFDEKAARSQKRKNHNRVAWAVEIAHFQDGTKKIDSPMETEVTEPEKEQATEKKKGGEEKKPAVRAGSRRKIASLGIVANGTPAPKRKSRERS